MKATQLEVCLQQKNRLIHTYALLGMGMGIALMIIFSSIALLPMTELVEIAGTMVSVYLSTGILIYIHLESKLKRAKENALLLAVCQKLICDFQPHLNETQLLNQLRKMISKKLSRHGRIQLLKNYLENQEDLEKLLLSLMQNQAEVEILVNLGLRWGALKNSQLGFKA
jgi:hypothetical protein